MKRINEPGPAVTFCERCGEDFNYKSDGMSVPVFCDHCIKVGGFTAPEISKFLWKLSKECNKPVNELEKIYMENKG